LDAKTKETFLDMAQQIEAGQFDDVDAIVAAVRTENGGITFWTFGDESMQERVRMLVLAAGCAYHWGE
jgi:hypothetical protein